MYAIMLNAFSAKDHNLLTDYKLVWLEGKPGGEVNYRLL